MRMSLVIAISYPVTKMPCSRAEATHTPRVWCDQQHLFCAVDGLSPRLLAGIQLTCLGPRLDVGWAVLQQHSDGR